VSSTISYDISYSPAEDEFRGGPGGNRGRGIGGGWPLRFQTAPRPEFRRGLINRIGKRTNVRYAEQRQPRRGIGDSPPRWAGLLGPPGRAFRFTAGRAGHRCGSLPERNSGSGARESSIDRSAPAQEPRAAPIPALRKAVAEAPRFCPQSHLRGRKRYVTPFPLMPSPSTASPTRRQDLHARRVRALLAA